MVCNVDHFAWPLDDTPSAPQLDANLRPLAQPPHPDTPYVVILLKMLSISDDQPDEDLFPR